MCLCDQVSDAHAANWVYSLLGRHARNQCHSMECVQSTLCWRGHISVCHNPPATHHFSNYPTLYCITTIRMSSTPNFQACPLLLSAVTLAIRCTPETDTHHHRQDMGMMSALNIPNDSLSAKCTCVHLSATLLLAPLFKRTATHHTHKFLTRRCLHGSNTA